jgi:hypothetical protein
LGYIWKGGVISATEISKQVDLHEITVYGLINDGMTKFKPEFFVLGTRRGGDYFSERFNNKSKNESLEAISRFFSIDRDFFGEKLISCIEAMTYPKSRLTPPNLNPVADGIDLILERGDEISLENYEIHPEMVKFFIGRQILFGDVREIDFSDIDDIDGALIDDHGYEYLDDIEVALWGCEEGVL